MQWTAPALQPSCSRVLRGGGHAAGARAGGWGDRQGVQPCRGHGGAGGTHQQRRSCGVRPRHMPGKTTGGSASPVAAPGRTWLSLLAPLLPGAGAARRRSKDASSPAAAADCRAGSPGGTAAGGEASPSQHADAAGAQPGHGAAGPGLGPEAAFQHKSSPGKRRCRWAARLSAAIYSACL